MNRTYKVGLVIGRFQPFHNGHKYLIEKSLKLCDQIIIGIGSSNKKDRDNPWNARRRKKFLEEFFKKSGYENRVLKIVKVPDHPDDDIWLEKLFKKTGTFDVTIGNNEWNNGIIERHGIPAVKIGFENRDKWEGTKIRNLIENQMKWDDRVPDYLVKLIRTSRKPRSFKNRDKQSLPLQK